MCLSTNTGLKWRSKRSLSGSMLIGLCLLPLLHKDHWGFISPQNAGPVSKTKKKTRLIFTSRSISYDKWRINFQNNSLSNRACVLVWRLNAIRVLFYQISSVIREILQIVLYYKISRKRRAGWNRVSFVFN